MSLIQSEGAGHTVLVFGTGKLAGPVVDTLALQYPGNRYVLVSRSRERSLLRANLTRYIAAQWGRFPEVIAEQANILDVEQTASLICRLKPSIVFNATTPFAWWKLESLPAPQRARTSSAGPGVWCALDCLLPLKLTQALELAGAECAFVNACYPDLTNAFLSKSPSAPRIGIGNISNLVPGLQLAFAALWDESPADVRVRLVGHHYLSWNAPTPAGSGDSAYDLTIESKRNRVRYRGPDDGPFKVLRKHASRVRGLEGLSVTIGSAATVLSTLIRRQRANHHCPGASGLPGGYPVVIDEVGAVTLDLPPELSQPDAIAINEQSQALDGVAFVQPGVVQASPLAQETFFEIVGEHLPLISRDNVESVSQVAIDRLNQRYSLGLSL